MTKPVWEKPNPVKKSTKLSPMQKAKARARARNAGRPYPNMVDNIWAANEEFDLKKLGSNPGKFKRLVAKHLGAKAADKIDGADGSRIMAMAKRKGDTTLYKQGSFIKNFYGEAYEEGSKEIRVAYARMTPGQTPFVLGLDKNVSQDNARELRRRRAKKFFKAYFDEARKFVYDKPLRAHVKLYSDRSTEDLKGMHSRWSGDHSDAKSNPSTSDRLLAVHHVLKQRGESVGELPKHKNLGTMRTVSEEKALGKPFRTPGENKKFAVYVRNDRGNTVKVRFGDPNLSIKRDNPVRRKSFRARHNCANPGPRTKARYWSCRMWARKKVSDIA